jgi:hypothetical protein
LCVRRHGKRGGRGGAVEKFAAIHHGRILNPPAPSHQPRGNRAVTVSRFPIRIRPVKFNFNRWLTLAASRKICHALRRVSTAALQCYIDRGATEFVGTLQLDFLWSIARHAR